MGDNKYRPIFEISLQNKLTAIQTQVVRSDAFDRMLMPGEALMHLNWAPEVRSLKTHVSIDFWLHCCIAWHACR